MASEIASSRIVAAFLRIKREKAAFDKSAKAISDEYDAKLDRLSTELLKRMNEGKVKNMSFETGQVIRQKEILPRADDWDKFYEWVRKTGMFEALERRIKRTFIEEYMEENKGAIPPGVSVMTSFKAIVKKLPSKKGLPTDGEE